MSREDKNFNRKLLIAFPFRVLGIVIGIRPFIVKIFALNAPFSAFSPFCVTNGCGRHEAFADKATRDF